jgi:hypothetical protein
MIVMSDTVGFSIQSGKDGIAEGTSQLPLGRIETRMVVLVVARRLRNVTRSTTLVLLWSSRMIVRQLLMKYSSKQLILEPPKLMGMWPRGYVSPACLP